MRKNHTGALDRSVPEVGGVAVGILPHPPLTEMEGEVEILLCCLPMEEEALNRNSHQKEVD